MAQENRVLIRTTPTVTPTLISYADFESSSAEKDGRKLYDGERSGYKQRDGLSHPIVMIGKVKLAKSMLKALSVHQDNFVPTISLTFADDGHVFTTRGYPLSNILVSVFIQSRVTKLKSFAADFIITNISSVPIPNSSVIMYTLGGELHIPKLYGNYSMSYPNLTSLQTLQKVASELQLGFADNQSEGTNDTMTWICPNYTYKEFITQVSKYAYRDDSNFFDCFIDRYYNLNFINVEKQFSRDEEVDIGYIALDQSFLNKDRVNPEKEDDSVVEVPLILSNYPEIKETEFYISDFAMVSNHGEILKNNALRRYLYWYEHNSVGSESSSPGGDKGDNLTDPPFRMHYLEPLESQTLSDGKFPQTTELPEYLSGGAGDKTEPPVSTNVWSGVDYGNAHSSYKFAELLNYHNWLETEKNILTVTLTGLSSNILRGSRVRVDIFLNKYDATMANVMADDQVNPVELNEMTTGNPRYDSKPQTLILDKALSDFYYVRSVNYNYMNGKFTTDLTLSRRHWLLPLAKNENIV